MDTNQSCCGMSCFNLMSARKRRLRRTISIGCISLVCLSLYYFNWIPSTNDEIAVLLNASIFHRYGEPQKLILVSGDDRPEENNEIESHLDRKPTLQNNQGKGHQLTELNEIREDLTANPIIIVPDSTMYDQSFNSLDIFHELNFTDSNWTNADAYFWNEHLEDRYKIKKKLPLKIIVIPHSHTDPGWGWTYEEYFNEKVRSIIDRAVDKLTQYPNMTFQWSEASFMDIWWQNASNDRKQRFKQLVHEKRLQIVTGGWVMTDEAIVSLYSMIDQLIEGQHWVKYHLDVLPEVSWSVDPFGFGSAFPYLLRASGIDSMVILRIHYAWKKWMAENQKGDFEWVQRWDTEKTHKILCHQVFYTMYLIANSLGPHTSQCRKFDFVDGATSINEMNIDEMANLFVEEAGRTASLFEHNVALPILGADFTFRFAKDWDKSYTNYMKLFNYINSRQSTFNTEVSFGTLSDYFKVIRERQPSFSSFSGDFFPYSDTQTKMQGRTAYWSGFYASRPFWKKLHRETENAVRTAEILFTTVISHAGVRNSALSPGDTTSFVEDYSLLVQARQYLALFAHHDAAPGVSAARVMIDYENKLMIAIENSLTVQSKALGRIFSHLGQKYHVEPLHELSENSRIYTLGKTKVFNLLGQNRYTILILNNLGWEKKKLIKVRVNSPNVGVMNSKGEYISSQLNPVILYNPSTKLSNFSENIYELAFIAKLPPLTFPTIYTIERLDDKSPNVASKSRILTNLGTNISSNVFIVKDWTETESKRQVEDEEKLYFIQNDLLQLGFSKTTGFLQQIKRLGGKAARVEMSFGGYTSVNGHSGPYLFMADTASPELKVPFATQMFPEIFSIEGSIFSEVSVSQNPQKCVFQLAVRILHVGSRSERDAVHIENQFDSKTEAGEYFMRFNTDLNTHSVNAKGGKPSKAFYTDQSGYTFEKRTIVDSIGVEGNYYPITTMAFIEDEIENTRFSVLVDRSHGAASLSSGSLEVMIERRLLYDDNRGIGQGIMDNRLTTSNYIIKLEKLKRPSGIRKNDDVIAPTLASHHLSQSLNYPPSKFILISHKSQKLPHISGFSVFSKYLPPDTVLLNMRTLPDFNVGANATSALPASNFNRSFSFNVLMIFQKLAFSCESRDLHCTVGPDTKTSLSLFLPDTTLGPDFTPTSIQRTDLTGLRNYSKIFQGKADFVDKLSSISAHGFEISALTFNFDESS